jgi:putative membrane protein
VDSRRAAAMLALVLVALALSGIGPRDRLTWFLEVAPVLIARLSQSAALSSAS